MLEAKAIHDRSTTLTRDGFMRAYLDTVCDALLRRHPRLRLNDAQLAASKVAMMKGQSPVRAAAQGMGQSGEDLSAVVTMAEDLTLSWKRSLPSDHTDRNAT